MSPRHPQDLIHDDRLTAARLLHLFGVYSEETEDAQTAAVLVAAHVLSGLSNTADECRIKLGHIAESIDAAAERLARRGAE